MSSESPKKAQKSFEQLLNNGSEVDEIFRDKPVPRGTDPFGVNVMNQEEQVGILTKKMSVAKGFLELSCKDFLPFGQVASDILKTTLQVMPAEAGSLLEIDFRNNCMFFRAVTGRSSENLLNFTVPKGQGIAGFVCETKQPMVLSSIDDSQLYLKSISDAVGFEAKNLVAVPIIIRGHSFGCIEILNKLDGTDFNDQDLDLIKFVVDCASHVIESRLIIASLTKAHSQGGKTAA